mmetsp:Transcript_9739/g.15663  ORF Transcript_9739/g.15663 Transcript_9739/m.15663 type:complete len:125 (+) Transcript_9739:76-450(+)
MSVFLRTACPSPNCPARNVVKQWFKADCGHRAKIDTQVDVFCEKRCNWSTGGWWVSITKVFWNCNQRKCASRQYDLDSLSASLSEASAALLTAALKGDEIAKADGEVLALIINNIAQKMRKNAK